LRAAANAELTEAQAPQERLSAIVSELETAERSLADPGRDVTVARSALPKQRMPDQLAAIPCDRPDTQRGVSRRARRGASVRGKNREEVK
jgi:hypothetical protein